MKQGGQKMNIIEIQSCFLYHTKYTQKGMAPSSTGGGKTSILSRGPIPF